MDLDVTISAIGVLRVQVVLRTCRLFRADPMRTAVTRETELRDSAGDQQAWISRAVRRVTRDTSVCFDRGVLVNKRPLFISMTLYASCVGTRRQSCLLQFETTVRIVTVAALHRAFQHFVMKRHLKLVFSFAVATQAELWFTLLQQADAGKPGLLSIGLADEDV